MWVTELHAGLARRVRKADQLRSNPMTDKKNKTKKKRLPKGLRKHSRRLKQEARKEDTVYRSPIIRRVPEKKPENSF